VSFVFLKKYVLGSDYSSFSNVIKVRRSRYKIKIPVLNPQVSYLCGAIAGDGNLTLIRRKDSIYPRTKLRVINSSEEFLNYLNNIIFQNFGYSAKIYKKGDGCFVLESNNKVVWLYITYLTGMKAGKKKNLHIPKRLRNRILLKHFLAGLFDTDGYYSRGRYGLMMSQKNHNFLHEIKSLGKRFYNLNFLGPYTDKIEFDGKSFRRSQINLSTKCNDNFIKVIPLKIKSGPSRIRTCDIHLS
jgi:hypothetical protein